MARTLEALSFYLRVTTADGYFDSAKSIANLLACLTRAVLPFRSNTPARGSCSNNRHAADCSSGRCTYPLSALSDESSRACTERTSRCMRQDSRAGAHAKTAAHYLTSRVRTQVPTRLTSTSPGFALSRPSDAPGRSAGCCGRSPGSLVSTSRALDMPSPAFIPRVLRIPAVSSDASPFCPLTI